MAVISLLIVAFSVYKYKNILNDRTYKLLYD